MSLVRPGDAGYDRHYEPRSREGVLAPINERMRRRLERAEAARPQILERAKVDERISRNLAA